MRSWHPNRPIIYNYMGLCRFQWIPCTGNPVCQKNRHQKRPNCNTLCQLNVIKPNIALGYAVNTRDKLIITFIWIHSKNGDFMSWQSHHPRGLTTHEQRVNYNTVSMVFSPYGFHLHNIRQDWHAKNVGCYSCLIWYIPVNIKHLYSACTICITFLQHRPNVWDVGPVL